MQKGEEEKKEEKEKIMMEEELSHRFVFLVVRMYASQQQRNLTHLTYATNPGAQVRGGNNQVWWALVFAGTRLPQHGQLVAPRLPSHQTPRH